MNSSKLPLWVRLSFRIAKRCGLEIAIQQNSPDAKLIVWIKRGWK